MILDRFISEAQLWSGKCIVINSLIIGFIPMSEDKQEIIV